MIDIKMSPEVSEAKSENSAVVALESTIITHGMPYPQNVETARRVEAEVRACGATPATIAVIDGELHVGISSSQLDRLGQAKDVAKLSRADFAVALATGQSGGTTVAATMIGARLAGIDVFATGGIGGVHRGAELSFDVSADLQELAQSPVTVVCAGAKAILDLPKTLEVLETLGVPVISFGQDALPAFWSRDSGLLAPLRLDSTDEIAKVHALRQAMGLPGGQLIANAIPIASEIPLAKMSLIVDQALEDADAQNISAKNVTPFLLDRIYHLTNGQSLEANIALVLNNARLAAQIAKDLSTIRR